VDGYGGREGGEAVSSSSPEEDGGGGGGEKVQQCSWVGGWMDDGGVG
jgi:hypothetical protein